MDHLDELRKYLQVLVGTDRLSPDRARAIMKSARAHPPFDFQRWRARNRHLEQLMLV